MKEAYFNDEDKSPCYVVHNAFDKEAAAKIIEQHKGSVHEATHVDGGKQKGRGLNIRDSSVVFFEDLSLHNYLDHWLKVANDVAGWKYDITSREAFQFTSYQKGDFYTWHMDGQGNHYNARKFTYKKPEKLTETAMGGLVGTVRKISMSIILNGDYEGGEFETCFVHEGKLIKKTVKAGAGDIIIFPSDLQHRVTPVTKGHRYSIVVWWAGPPFK